MCDLLRVLAGCDVMATITSFFKPSSLSGVPGESSSECPRKSDGECEGDEDVSDFRGPCSEKNELGRS